MMPIQSIDRFSVDLTCCHSLKMYKRYLGIMMGIQGCCGRNGVTERRRR